MTGPSHGALKASGGDPACHNWKLRATLTGCEGQVVCWKPLLLVDPQPDTNPSQLWFAVNCGRLCVELRREAESKKASVESRGV